MDNQGEAGVLGVPGIMGDMGVVGVSWVLSLLDSPLCFDGKTAILARDSVRDMLRRRLCGAGLVAWDAADVVADAKGSESRNEGLCGVRGDAGVRGGNGADDDRVGKTETDALVDCAYFEKALLAVDGRREVFVPDGD